MITTSSIEFADRPENSTVIAAPTAADSTPALRDILATCGFAVVGSQTLPGRPGTFVPMPEGLHERVRASLQDDFPHGIYSHQAQAIQRSLDGDDVCLSTATASGKSLVFMATAAHELLSDASARVLVLCPAKALIQDQLAKWNDLLSPLSLKAGFIDGSVPVAERNEILFRRRVVLMTPDVAHAWLMSNLNQKAVAAFRSNLRLLILDEAHVYDGVFGTNMAFFLRRLQAVSSPHRLICSTATLGQPGQFIEQLTGRHTVQIGTSADGARMAQKEIILARKQSGDTFDATANLLRLLAQEFPGRFLAFGDSRKHVELVTAASQRHTAEDANSEADSCEVDALTNPGNGILPYRAGYESADRKEIQEALTQGRLRGVVATSALEMGLDIGEIDLVLLLDTPASMKSFWQRVGRAGRRHRGICTIIDSRQVIGESDAGLAEYLARPIEPNWLYLHNRYAQYTNALCAAAEIAQINGSFDRSHFLSLPEQFGQFLDNELNPTTSIAPDLYPLKQAAQNDPHHEFPLRSGIEKSFRVITNQGENRGEVTFSQALREAYPGAVYYYMATPYRVQRLNYRDGEIMVHRERRYTTKPMRFAMVFPDFGPSVLCLQKCADGFLAEAEMQVSERVSGFKEKRGKTETTHTYGPGSSFSQQPLTRFIRTTGVCWFFPQSQLVSETLANSIMQAFCEQCGIQPRDLGVGRFHSQNPPNGTSPVNGVCIFDNSNGSLRLTERLAANFAAVVTAALAAETARGNTGLAAALEQLLAQLSDVPSLTAASTPPETSHPTASSTPDGWMRVIAPGAKAILITTSGTEEVTVLGHFYTPAGLQYHLEHPTPTIRWVVQADALEPINGVTVTQLYNLLTGELKEAA
ncbi:MAG: DEAD/DEAH box helicase [Verrucomicrobia bacterium]|nr:DEAD/DEAH box helicase [Verrucomicrobiota bacterium]